MTRVNLIPLSEEVKSNIKETLCEDINIGEIICYKNIIYRDHSHTIIMVDSIPLDKVSGFDEIPMDYEENEDDEVFFSYEMAIPIFSSIQSENVKNFINFSSILDNISIEELEECFFNTYNLILIYDYNNKTFFCTIGIKENIEAFQNGILKKFLIIDENNFDTKLFKELLEEKCIMTNVLNKCSEIIQENKDKYDNYEEKKICLDCVKGNFRSYNRDTYDCVEKLAHYTIFYGPIYVSEIYHFLRESQILENNFLEFDKSINVMSLGCGFGPDKIALEKYRKDKWLDIEFYYTGYDIEPLWLEISSPLMTGVPEIKNIIKDNFDCSETNIIFLNKVFSTLKNNDLHEDFLDNFKNL